MNNNLSEYEKFLINNGYFKRCIENENNNNYSSMYNNFTNPEEGFLKGNMENNLYVPYKNNNVVNPNIKNEKEYLLMQIQEYDFASHDINLYLDTHPNDTNAINMYNEYKNKEHILEEQYQSKYGPLNLDNTSVLGNTPWEWINEPWPWNKDV